MSGEGVPDRIVLEPERRAITNISRSTAWRMWKKGTFPRPVVLVGRIVGWRLSELQLWVQSREPRV